MSAPPTSIQNPKAAGTLDILVAEPAMGAICVVCDETGCLVAVLLTPVVVLVG